MERCVICPDVPRRKNCILDYLMKGAAKPRLSHAVKWLLKEY